jgi:hypothetical protein
LQDFARAGGSILDALCWFAVFRPPKVLQRKVSDD